MPESPRARLAARLRESDHRDADDLADALLAFLDAMDRKAVVVIAGSTTDRGRGFLQVGRPDRKP